MSKQKFLRMGSLSLLLILLLAVAAFSLAGCCKEDPKLSEGQKSFGLQVVFLDGTSEEKEVTTEETTVGAALLKAGLIEGEEGPYGIYVKKVLGVLADYDIDATYWAFYIGDTMASTGADQTEINDGTTYRFVQTKG